MATDELANIYLTGYTRSADFPVTSTAWQKQHSTFGSDGFVARFDASSGALTLSTYLGAGEGQTGGDDEPTAISIDPSHRMLVAGRTRSVNFPQLDPVQPGRADTLNPDGTAQRCRQPGAAILQPCWDGFVTMMSEAGDSLVFSTFLGGPQDDSITGAASVNGRSLLSSTSQLAAVGLSFTGAALLTRSDWLRQPTSHRRTDSLLAKGALATLYARNLVAGGTLETAAAPLPLELAGVRLTAGGIPAPLLAVANTANGELVNFQVPWELDDSQAPVPIVLSSNGRNSLPIFVQSIAPWNPEILRLGDGETAWSVQTLPGLISIFATGLGPVSPPIASGAAPDDSTHITVLKPTIRLDDVPVAASSCSLLPGIAGVYRVDFPIPPELSGRNSFRLSLAVEAPGLSLGDQAVLMPHR